MILEQTMPLLREGRISRLQILPTKWCQGWTSENFSRKNENIYESTVVAEQFSTGLITDDPRTNKSVNRGLTIVRKKNVTNCKK